jgi:hypothetical protein
MPEPAKAELTIERHMELVQIAIDRIYAVRKHFRDTEADPTADSEDRGAARHQMKSIELEFWWQFQNVEVLLVELRRFRQEDSRSKGRVD